MQEFAINDKETLHVEGYTPSVVDLAGFNFKNADGSDVTPDQVGVAWGTDNPGVADLSGMGATGGDVGSTAPGRAVLTATLTYPDGSTKAVSYGLTVGFSAAGEPTMTVTVVPEP